MKWREKQVTAPNSETEQLQLPWLEVLHSKHTSLNLLEGRDGLVMACEVGDVPAGLPYCLEVGDRVK